MSEPKKPAFFAQPQVTWGPYGKPITTEDFKDCPELSHSHFGSDSVSSLESVSKLFQLIERGECPGDGQKVPHVTYRLARPLIEKQLAAYGQEKLRERWSRYEALATEFALEELDTVGRQPLDGFIPYDLFVKGARHHFGIEDDALESMLMDEGIAFDLPSYWRGASDIAKFKDADLLWKLLTPKQKTYLKFILKKKAPANKTGYLDLRREKKTMGCEFKEINGRCYFEAGLRGPEGSYFDLLQDENGQEVIGHRAVDPQDLFQPPGAKEPSPVQPNTYYAEDREGRILSLGHFFGRSIDTLHPRYYHSYFTPHYSTADLLVITPRELYGMEVALLSNDLFNIYMNDKVPHWEEPITDDHPQLPGILERLKKIVVGELKPPRVYKEDTKQKEYEDQNSKRALGVIHLYWRLGSDEAGKTLDSSPFKELLKKHSIERKPRFELITQKLEEQKRQKPVGLGGNKETAQTVSP